MNTNVESYANSQFTSFTSPVFNSKPFFFAFVNETVKKEISVNKDIIDLYTSTTVHTVYLRSMSSLRKTKIVQKMKE